MSDDKTEATPAEVDAGRAHADGVQVGYALALRDRGDLTLPALPQQPVERYRTEAVALAVSYHRDVLGFTRTDERPDIDALLVDADRIASYITEGRTF